MHLRKNLIVTKLRDINNTSQIFLHKNLSVTDFLKQMEYTMPHEEGIPELRFTWDRQ